MKSLVRIAGPCVFDWTRLLESLTVWLCSLEVRHTLSLNFCELKISAAGVAV